MNPYTSQTLQIDPRFPAWAQGLFNEAVTGLASQGFKRALRDQVSQRCAYRAPNGDRCAIGWCIPDVTYSVTLEGSPAVAPNVRELIGADLPHRVTFVSRLQTAHDKGYKPATMIKNLRWMAKQYQLTWPRGARLKAWWVLLWSRSK